MKHYLHLKDGTVWASPDDHDLEWTLRYGNPETIIEKRFIIASYLYSYKEMISKTNSRRNQICNEIKAYPSEHKGEQKEEL